MLACNDLSTANQALGDWKAAREAGDRSIRPGGGRYFVRIQAAHLYETFDLLDRLRKDADLKGFLDRCDEQTKRSFASLARYLHGGPEHGRLQRLIGILRSQVTFHYGEQSHKLLTQAMKFKSGRGVDGVSMIQRGSDARQWHFQVAEDIVDSVVVRQLWGVPPDVDEQAAADQAADEMHAIFLAFMDFAGEFIWHYCETL